MNRYDFDDMIEKYKKELMNFNKNSSFKEDENIKAEKGIENVMEEAIPVVAMVSDDPPMGMNNQETVEDMGGTSVNESEPQEITELVGTNPENYSSGRKEKTYDTYDEFLKDNPEKGRLRVRTFAGNGAFPIANARVVVKKALSNGQEKIIYDELTDISGEVNDLILPAPSRSLSEQPNMTVPYSTYTVTVTHPKYVKSVYKNVPIFDGIESMQNVNMIPIINDKMKEQEKVYEEQEPSDL